MSTKTDDWEKEFDEIWEARPAPEQRTHLKEAIKEFISSHTTYWKERVREATERVRLETLRDLLTPPITNEDNTTP